jgi:L-asparaginase
MNTRVLVIYTGGTIGMLPSDPADQDSELIPAARELILSYVPNLGHRSGIDWHVVPHTNSDGDPLAPLDSCDMTLRHWLGLAHQIERHYSDYDGFVILHGTDTMAYTASALSFLLAHLSKPVVLTGAQLPLSHERSDGRVNFANALYVAGYKATELPDVPEVTVCFGDKLLRGNRARKMSTADFNAFDSPNYIPLGRLGEHIAITEHFILRSPGPFHIAGSLDDDVVEFHLYPGIQPRSLRAILQQPDIRGFVMRTFGAGNAMTDPAILHVIAHAVTSGKTILNVTQCPRGMVEMGRYQASRGLIDTGVISGFDMTPEAALVKMMWLMAQSLRPAELRRQLQLNHRGEQSAEG